MGTKLNLYSTKVGAIIAWCIATTFAFFQFFLQTATSVMSASWLQDFHLNTLQLSNLSAAFFYPYLLMQIPVGLLYDRFRAKYVLSSAAGLLALGCLLLASAKTYELAIVGRILMGIGASFGYVGMLNIIIRYFSIHRFAFVLGLSESLSTIAVTLGVIFLAYFLKLHSWRFMMFLCAVTAFALLILILCCMKEPESHLEKTPITFAQILRQLKDILTNTQIILCSLYGFFLFALVNAFTSLWGVSFITNTYHFSHELAASQVSIVFIGIMVGGPLNGLFSKTRLQRTQIMQYGAIGIALCTALVIFLPHLNAFTLFTLLFLAGFFCSMYIHAFSIIKDTVSLSVQATALAASNMIIMSAAPLLQILIGSLLDSKVYGLATSNAMNYRLSLSLLPLGMFIAFILSKFIREPQTAPHPH